MPDYDYPGDTGAPASTVIFDSDLTALKRKAEQRDGLLGALKRIADLDIGPGGWDGPKALRVAKNAIAKCKEKSDA